MIMSCNRKAWEMERHGYTWHWKKWFGKAFILCARYVVFQFNHRVTFISFELENFIAIYIRFNIGINNVRKFKIDIRQTSNIRYKQFWFNIIWWDLIFLKKIGFWSNYIYNGRKIFIKYRVCYTLLIHCWWC